MMIFHSNFQQRELNAVDFKVSADLKFVLLISDVRPGWRHARLARYHVYDVINRYILQMKNKTTYRLFHNSVIMC